MANVLNKIIRKAIGIFEGGLSQEQAKWAEEAYDVPEEAKKDLRQLAAEGIVMLKNNDTLPLAGKRVAVFGRCQYDYFYCGYGSGGDVNIPYKVSFAEALHNQKEIIINKDIDNFYREMSENNPPDEGYWGHWPFNFPEFIPDEDLIRKAADECDAAVIVIGRAAGEDRENKLINGSYYLTDDEIRLLDNVTENFGKTVVVLDCGNIIDMEKINSYKDKISAILYAFQGGMESGNALCDVLSGKVNPCAKLTDTIAHNYDDYPGASDFGGKDFNNYTEDIFVGYRYFETFASDKVLFPFGYGLSYTSFSIEPEKFLLNDDGVTVKIRVTNTGNVAGKQIVQLYCEQPCGKTSTAKRVLCSFAKTELLNAGESCILDFDVSFYSVSSYDDIGKTGFKNSYVLLEGWYKFFASDSVRGGTECGSFEVDETYCIQELQPVCAVKNSFTRMTRMYDGRKGKETVPAPDTDLKKRILDNLPPDLPCAKDCGYKLSDVKSKKITMDEFVSQLTLKELEAITRGDYTMHSPLGTSGNAGVFGGVLPSLRAKGIPPLSTTDGPAGIRVTKKRSLLPTGACMAASWNTPLIEKVYSFVASEMKECGSDILLAPGMNIHRNPLCGRNFEYFSEDPVVSGKCAAAVVRGVQSLGASACPKHFACNNQEVNRNKNDSRVSERALREIYLKPFEIAVKESAPKNIMTSYNKVNSVYSYNNYDMVTTVLRGEWGYTGNIMTDWWTKHTESPEFKGLRDNAYRVRAQVDVLMPGVNGRFGSTKKPDPTLLETFGSEDGIKLGEMQRSAKNVLKLCLDYID
ncbi:MAG: glycoside hydrolase family 3 C-terminal domain-containing protein [Acutalibacteraceae bacterium]|nr:glycoside hydrolase family 3 C-terminal domain-containing protein [Acutalibacteraceae bacterium]